MVRTPTQREGDGHIVGLQNLTRFLSAFDGYGFTGNSGEVLGGGSAGSLIPTSHSPGIDKSDIFSLLQSLDDLKLCMVAVNYVRDILGKRMRLLRKACTPWVLQEGIKVFPDEILSAVFEAGHYSTAGWAFTKAVSQVSRRFRQVSLNTPLLWTRISGEYTLDQVESFLSRSGDMGLDISCLRYDSDQFIAFLRRLRPHSNRWTKLRYFDNKAEHEMRNVGCGVLPLVKTVHHICNVYDFYWESPSLFSDYVSVNPPGPIIHSRLTSLEFVAIGNGNCPLDISRLAHAIYSMENLKQLSLTLDRCSHDNSQDFEIRDPHSVPIDTLQVTIKGRTSYYLQRLLCDSLSFLVPSTVHLTLVDIRDTESHVELFCLCVGDSGELLFPYGSVIKITAMGNNYRFWPTQNVQLLVLLVKSCKIAHTIHFEVGGMSLISRSMSTDDWKHFSALRHLRFTRCDQLTEWQLRALVTNLMIGAKDGEGLQTLEVFDCRGISEECLLDLSDEVGSKLIWKH